MRPGDLCQLLLSAEASSPDFSLESQTLYLEVWHFRLHMSQTDSSTKPGQTHSSLRLPFGGPLLAWPTPRCHPWPRSCTAQAHIIATLLLGVFPLPSAATSRPGPAPSLTWDHCHNPLLVPEPPGSQTTARATPHHVSHISSKPSSGFPSRKIKVPTVAYKACRD